MIDAKPLQVICSSVACRRRQTVAVDRVWYVDVRRGPGSHREAGWACRFCGMENITPPSHLPRNTIPMLASREQVLDRTPAFAGRRRPEGGSDAPIVSARRPGPPLPPSSASSPIAVRDVDATSVSKPPADGTAMACGSASRPDAELGDDDGTVRAGREAPTWTIGAPAKAILVEALFQIMRHGGSAVAIAAGPNGYEAVDVALPGGSDLDDARMARFADSLLDEVDEAHANVVVLGGTVDGRRWEVILHVEAGAASFT